jgi:hypothetical protein
MVIGLIVVGLTTMAVIAVFIGLAGRDERVGRDRAWREIAHERRQNWEERQRIEQLYAELEHCRDCPLRPPELVEEERRR